MKLDYTGRSGSVTTTAEAKHITEEGNMSKPILPKVSKGGAL
jgi:hypothetical protein